MMARDEATERQVQASQPNASTWLAANAGSGKTRVLTDRVARLLLEGVEPQNILCLTYTKAAASEMQNRLFRRLGEWAMLGDPELMGQLAQLGAEETMSAERLRHARTLFARAIEAPGGLKIQTIHSFCAGLLRRFPLEAGISPQFTEMEDRAAKLLRAQIVEDFAGGENAHLVDGVARYLTDADFDGLTKAVIGNRDAFQTPMPRDELNKVLGLPPGFDGSEVLSGVFLGGEDALLSRVVSALRAGGANDQKAAEKLAALRQFDLAALAVMESVFLFGSSAAAPFCAKLETFPTKNTQAAMADDLLPLHALMERVEGARQSRLLVLTAEKSHALHAFAHAFLPEFERRKQIRGWLDFDDQIMKARQLLNDPAVAAWVLFRLDGGIDHILVDEAQDTSPEQWDVIEKLAQEFTSGEGARGGIQRTIFVVGDKKQSIYSFQGADPREFDRMQIEFSNRLEGSGTRLESLTLEHSFRSAESILRLVDLVFLDKPDAGFAGAKHRAFKSDLPGRVDLWPAVEKVDDRLDQHWSEPLDRPSPRSHTVVLAEQIATGIREMIARGETIPDEKDGQFFRRPVTPGDFLILVQRRSELFAEIIRACKAAELPIAGADRLKIGAELAVRDLGALLRFLATPEDDLSLACALKSPLFGWSEQDLFTLAHDRDDLYLWTRLRERSGDHPETLKMITDLRDSADFLRPFDLIERILTRHAGRRNLLGRLGVEAEDGINALLGQALAYERTEIPNLTGFLSWMETDDLEIKRQLGNAGNKIRVMTVHGAKGLESPIVVLPDTAKRLIRDQDSIMFKDGTAFWKPRSDDMPECLRDGRDYARERELQERQRLLYVALTRAEKWLIVAAAGDLDKDRDSWYQHIESAMIKTNAVERAFVGGTGLCLEDEEWNDLAFQSVETSEPPEIELPDYFDRPAPQAEPEQDVISPSDLGGAKALAGDEGDDEEAAKLRGTRIHLLLEHLPEIAPDRWQTVTPRILRDADPTECRALLAEAMQVLNHPDLAFLFQGETLAEVPVTAEIATRRVHGIIDRLVLSDDRVLAVDYKSNAIVPADAHQCPEGLLRQMGAYAMALGQIYPGRTIETAILWTRTASLMILPQDIVINAANSAPHLDVTTNRS